VETNSFCLFLRPTEDHAPEGVVSVYGCTDAHLLVVSRQNFLSVTW
jgi:hypothetical protein